MVKRREHSPGRSNLVARPKGSIPTVNVTMRMELPLKEKVEAMAEKEHRSLSNALQVLLREALEARRKRVAG